VGLPVDPFLATLFIALGTWLLLEQVPGHVDRFVQRRGHIWLGGVVALSSICVFVGRSALGMATEPYEIRLGVLAFSGLLIAKGGSSRQGRLLLASSAVDATIRARESTRREVLLLAATMTILIGFERLVVGHESFVGGAIGGLVGGLIGIVIFGQQPRDLHVTAAGIVVTSPTGIGRSFVPWHRIRTISSSEGRVRIERGLPWPQVYVGELASIDDPQVLVQQLQYYRRTAD
jgi:hypothetical protein